MRLAPSSEVVHAFGANGEPAPLDGGEGLTFRAGDVVLKRVHDEREAAWTQELCARIERRDFTIPEPLSTSDGAWVHGGWAASRFTEGLTPLSPRWSQIIEIGMAFSDAATQMAPPGVDDVLGTRTHRWAVADRVAWGEATVDLAAEPAEARDRLTALLGDPSADRQVIHGDLTGNVHVDPNGVPVVLDVSPYLRPRRWAAAIVVGDAVLWHGASRELAASFAGTRATDRDLLARALLFRLVAEQLAVQASGTPRHGADIAPYHRVLDALV